MFFFFCFACVEKLYVKSKKENVRFQDILLYLYTDELTFNFFVTNFVFAVFKSIAIAQNNKMDVDILSKD